MQKTNVAVLGCGWLGLPLAKALLMENFNVHGSTTSASKLQILELCGIRAYQITVGGDRVHGEIKRFLDGCDTLIIDIPPGRNSGAENFPSKINTIIPFIENSSVENVLFVSSTSVYGNHNGVITERTSENPNTESGRQLLAAEQSLCKRKFRTTLLRFGGLIGDDRHPAYSLSGKQGIENPDAAVNLIHQTDCIAIIQRIIKIAAWDEIFNAVAPFHPTRENYYSKKAIQFNLALPIFSREKSGGGKIIDSSKLVQTLGYEFLKPEL